MPTLTPERTAEERGTRDRVLENGPERGTLTEETAKRLLAYCKLTELADDPEVAALIPVLYQAAVGYLDQAGVLPPEPGTPRAAQYELCVNYLVLDAWERRETCVQTAQAADNPMFRQLLNQLKLTEGGGVYG